MNRDHDEKVIRHMYESIETPHYDVTKDVMKRIHPVSRGRVVLKRVVIAAAILCVCFTFLAAAKLIIWQEYNLFGEQVNSPATSAMPQQYELTQYDQKFLDETKLGEVRFMTSEELTNEKIGGVKTDDLDTILNYVKNSNSPMVLPSFIPEGYEFRMGWIQFYLDEESLNAEMISSKEKEGKLYEVHKLPEGYDQNIQWITLCYDGENGDELRYEVHLMGALGDNCSFSHYSPESAVVENIEISGFDLGIMIYDTEKTNGYLYTAIAYREVPSFAYRSSLIDSNSEDSFEYSAINCSIITENLDEEVVMEIMESIP